MTPATTPSIETLTELYRAALALQAQGNRAVERALEGIRKHAPEAEAGIVVQGSVTFDYKRFEQMAERTVQDAIDSASMSPVEGYHELEGPALAVADDCFLAGVQAMKTAMLNAIFDEMNGNGPIDPPSVKPLTPAPSASG